MERKWLVGGVVGALALVAVLALVVGGVVGRSIVPTPAEPRAPGDAAVRRHAHRRRDLLSGDLGARNSRDQAVRILASSPDASAGVSVSVASPASRSP